MIVRTFTDPAGTIRELHIGAETAGVRHDDCDQLAEVSPELDVAYCAACSWQCRISGAWYTELLAATRQTLATGSSTEDLEAQWKAERDRAATTMATPTGTMLGFYGESIKLHQPCNALAPIVLAGAHGGFGGLVACRREHGHNGPHRLNIEWDGAITQIRLLDDTKPHEYTELSIGDTCPCCGEEWTGA